MNYIPRNRGEIISVYYRKSVGCEWDNGMDFG